MKFEIKKNRFQGNWIYQAEFIKGFDTREIKSWFAGRNFGDFEIISNCFYTNELQDVFVLRIQFDAHLKMIRQSES